MIYIHVPFCHRKCTYCAFYSRPVVNTPSPQQGVPPKAGGEMMESYVDAVLREMVERSGEQAHTIRTVYFGGGTPSILPIEQLARIVEGLQRCFDLSQVEEMTLEANPEDLGRDYLAALQQLGFNRLSIGVQSLDDRVLRMLNRRHTVQQALEAVENAHAAGFENISVDFIYGLGPLEGLGSLGSLEHITHVSAYALTVEPGTALAVQVEQGRVVLPDEEEVVRQYHAMHRRLEAAGFIQYEVSNYARPGFASKHNSRYWNRTPYLGLGPGAHSFDDRHRRWNVSDVEAYVAGLLGGPGLPGKPWFEQETLTEADAYNEMLMTALRTVRGLPLAAVPSGQRERLHRSMQPYIDCGWIVASPDAYRPTAEGLLHADGMAAALFLD